MGEPTKTEEATCRVRESDRRCDRPQHRARENSLAHHWAQRPFGVRGGSPKRLDLRRYRETESHGHLR